MSSLRPSIPAADRISYLPESVLSHILSFLPTKLAMATSILSKRWTKLWLSVPTLDVDEESFKDLASFRLFVYSVIASRHPNLPIVSFHIRGGKSSKFNPCDLNRFVLAAVQRGLQNFYLELDMYLFIMYGAKILAPTIFQVLSCETLVVLKLKNLCVLYDDDHPHLVHLPLLKTLHLEDIYFQYVYLMNLLNGSPILEDLHINSLELNDDWWHVSMKKFKGFPNLVRAYIHRCDLLFPFAWLYNAKFMSVGVEEMSIYKYRRVPTFHNLTHMELLFHCEWSEMWVIQVLQHCPKLQNLILIQAPNDLEFDVEVVIEVEDWKDQETVPECLSSQLRTCSLKGFQGNQRMLHFAEYIMLNSKILRTMTIESNLVDEKAKYQMLKKLSSYSRGCVTCKLFFD